MQYAEYRPTEMNVINDTAYSLCQNMTKSRNIGMNKTSILCNSIIKK